MTLKPDTQYDEWFDDHHPRIQRDESKSCLSYFERNKLICRQCGKQDVHTRDSHRYYWCRKCREEEQKQS